MRAEQSRSLYSCATDTTPHQVNPTQQSVSLPLRVVSVCCCCAALCLLLLYQQQVATQQCYKQTNKVLPAPPFGALAAGAGVSRMQKTGEKNWYPGKLHIIMHWAPCTVLSTARVLICCCCCSCTAVHIRSTCSSSAVDEQDRIRPHRPATCHASQLHTPRAHTQTYFVLRAARWSRPLLEPCALQPSCFRE